VFFDSWNVLLGEKVLKKDVWLAGESQHQGLVFLRFMGVVCCDSRSVSGKSSMLLFRLLWDSRVLV